MSAWYDRAFGPWYLRLYPHRDLAEAERLAGLLAPELPAGGRYLDVACGAGRHVDAFRRRGAVVFGLDRSWDLLREAPDGVRTRLARGDMRELPFADGAFAAAFSLFTSFGYFDGAVAHRALLAEIARVVDRGGVFVLDYANAPRVRAGLVPRSERTVDGHAVVEERRILHSGPGERMVKTVTVTTLGGAGVASYEESVALYDPEEVMDMLHDSAFRVRRRFGDYTGSPWSTGAERLLVIAERVGG